MTYTVHLTEINRGSAKFETREDAEDFLRAIESDLVTWDSSEVTEASIEPTPD